MILVIGTAVMIAALVVAGMTIAVNGLAQSRNRQQFEQSLAAAENGIDWGLAKVQTAFDQFNRDYPVPGPDQVIAGRDVDDDSCDGTPINYPAAHPDGVFPTEDAERSWARDQLEVIATISGCLMQGGTGDFAILKPVTPLVNGQYPKYGKVYAMSWIPAYGDPEATTRLVKSEYIFMPYRPTHAVLTGGPVDIDSSTTVQGAFGVDPALASVHSNATVSTSGNPTVTGPVTSTGTSTASSNRFTSNPGGDVTSGVNLQKLPKVDARSLYFQAATNDPAAVSSYWYDLCPDGSIRAYSFGGPCTSTTIYNPGPASNPADYSLPFLGWDYDGNHTWSATRDAASGVWFAHQANVTTTNGPDPHFPNFTVIASSENHDDCASKKYGNIEWDHHSIRAPGYHNLWMYADSDIVTSSNFSAGTGTTSQPVISGMFVAGDQIELSTSSAGAVGSVVGVDQCTSPSPLPVGLVTENSVKNPTIWYDPNSDAPFTSVINTTLWLDYSG